MQNSKRILILSYYYPPVAGAATFRSLEFVKHLPEFGWRPMVLSILPSSASEIDSGLCEQTPVSVPVARVGHLHPKQVEKTLLVMWSVLWKMRLRSVAHRLQPYKVMRWMLPDVQASWLIPGLLKARALVRQYKPQVILTTAPPYTTHLIGLILKQQFGVSWVADYQDPWSQNPFTVYPSTLHHKLDRWLDRKTLQSADLVLGATDGITQGLQSLRDGQTPGRFGTVWIGYEPSDFTSIRQPKPQKSRLQIAYIGSLYGLRRADWFLATINELIESGEIDADKVMITFLGADGTGDTARYIGKPWFVYQNHLSHAEALDAMVAADHLLLLVNHEAVQQVPLKLFEYLGANRPIICIAPPSSIAARIVQEAKAGVIIPPNDTQTLKQAVGKLFEEWRQSKQGQKPSLEDISFYARPRQVEILAALLDSLSL